MRKFIAGLLVFASVSAVAISASKVDELNATVAKLLAEFNNTDTVATVVFKKIEFDAVKTLHFDVRAFFSKTGPENVATLQLEPVSYVYGDGTAPELKLAGAVGLNLAKVIPQKEFNGLVPDIEKTLEQIGADVAKEYGDAAQIKVVVSNKTQDAQGNYTGIKGSTAVIVDLSKLPADKKIEDVIITSANAEVSLDYSKGVSASVSAILNPKYTGFRQDEDGMKEYLEKLLAQDKDLMDSLQGWVRQLDSWGTDLVNRKAPEDDGNQDQDGGQDQQSAQ